MMMPSKCFGDVRCTRRARVELFQKLFPECVCVCVWDAPEWLWCFCCWNFRQHNAIIIGRGLSPAHVDLTHNITCASGTACRRLCLWVFMWVCVTVWPQRRDSAKPQIYSTATRAHGWHKPNVLPTLVIDFRSPTPFTFSISTVYISTFACYSYHEKQKAKSEIKRKREREKGD